MENDTPRTEPQPAPKPRGRPKATPESVPPPVPQIIHQPARRVRIERQGDSNAPMARFWPKVTGGVCDFCGILDNKQPAGYQYKLCPHYRGMDLMCSYCPKGKDHEQIVGHSTLNIFELLDKPGELVVVCGSFDCNKKHQDRFNRPR